MTYTGVEIIIPEKSYFVITALIQYNNARVYGIGMSSNRYQYQPLTENEGSTGNTSLSCTLAGYNTGVNHVYVWGKYNGTATNNVHIHGFICSPPSEYIHNYEYI